jgi:hypothetical protein
MQAADAHNPNCDQQRVNKVKQDLVQWAIAKIGQWPWLKY